ncbi:JmjC domain-containing protein [Marinomonas epiphytica]
MMDLDSPLSLLGGMTARTFLSEYWQKKPLLIRQALADFTPPLDADELAGLAMEEEVEARIVIEKGEKPWQLLQGPFDEDTFATLPEKEWSLLVQAVDHWVPDIQSLKEQFQFLPSWRLDDVMVSYATEGGSVGPHYDQYDVFLLQAAGQRRWQVLAPEQYQDHPMQGVDLHILQNFEADPKQDWLLDAGDMLYLPPNFAHNGRALDNECMTYSIGFRAPSMQDALTGIRDKLCEEINAKHRFSAPESLTREHSAQIHPSDIDYLQTELSDMLAQPENLAQWLGTTMSESKYPEYQSALTQQETLQAFEQAVAGQTFFRPGDARICYYEHETQSSLSVFCNGESIKVSHTLTGFVQALCEQSEFDFSQLDLSLEEDLKPLLFFIINQQGLVALSTNEEE